MEDPMDFQREREQMSVRARGEEDSTLFDG